MFETSYSDSYGRRLRLASVHHEYGRLALATAGLLYCSVLPIAKQGAADGVVAPWTLAQFRFVKMLSTLGRTDIESSTVAA